MMQSLSPPTQRLVWALMVAVGVFVLFLLFERMLGRFGLDFIVYFEPADLQEDRRLPVEGRESVEYAIRTVDTFDDAASRQPTTLMVHGDARSDVDFNVVRSEFERGTVVIVVNMSPEELAPLIDPGIGDVATVNETLQAPFYTLIAKNEEQCPTGLQPGCGAYLVEARNFTDFAELSSHAREALNVRLRALLTPTPEPVPAR
ncbi:MAG: hypothetical protein OXG65_13365 [Chloroflexi bacterium]|nr:hypothetical protein [Chloroflexota bacterium]